MAVLSTRMPNSFVVANSGLYVEEIVALIWFDHPDIARAFILSNFEGHWLPHAQS